MSRISMVVIVSHPIQSRCTGVCRCCDETAPVTFMGGRRLKNLRGSADCKRAVATVGAGTYVDRAAGQLDELS